MAFTSTNGSQLPSLRWLKQAPIVNGRTSGASILAHSEQVQPWEDYRTADTASAVRDFEASLSRVISSRTPEQSETYDKHLTTFKQGGWDLRQATMSVGLSAIIDKLDGSYDRRAMLNDMVHYEEPTNLKMEENEVLPSLTEWKRAAVQVMSASQDWDPSVSVADLVKPYEDAVFRQGLSEVPSEKSNLNDWQANVR